MQAIENTVPPPTTGMMFSGLILLVMISLELFV